MTMAAPTADADHRQQRPHVIVADFLTGLPEHRRLRVCRDAVLAGDGLRYVAHYTDETCNFAIDLFDDLDAARQVDTDPAQMRRAILETGDELVYRLKDFDQRLSVAKSGALIRTVYHARYGALYCYRVVPGEYVIAASLIAQPARLPSPRQTEVWDTDKAASTLVTRLRKELSRGAQDPGGFEHADESGTTVTRPLVETGTEIGAVAAASRRALSVSGLHHIAWVKDRQQVYAADILDAPELGRFFPNTDITPGLRRAFYHRLAPQVSRIYPELAGLVEPVIGNPLQRVVLDVEEGAIYCYRLGAGQFLLGVTIDQDRVSHADDAMADLTISVQK